MILSYELEVMARKCTKILRALLGPCADVAIVTCEASEQKRPKIPKPKRKELELSFLLYLICLNELIILVWSNVTRAIFTAAS